MPVVGGKGLKYRYKGKAPNEKVEEFDNAIDLIDKIRDGTMTIPGGKIDQVKFKSKLGEIKKGNNNNKKSKEQKNAIHNIAMLYKARDSVIEFYNNYSSMLSKAKK